jgi:hypothetical protein
MCLYVIMFLGGCSFSFGLNQDTGFEIQDNLESCISYRMSHLASRIWYLESSILLQLWPAVFSAGLPPTPSGGGGGRKS